MYLNRSNSDPCNPHHTPHLLASHTQMCAQSHGDSHIHPYRSPTHGTSFERSTIESHTNNNRFITYINFQQDICKVLQTKCFHSQHHKTHKQIQNRPFLHTSSTTIEFKETRSISSLSHKHCSNFIIFQIVVQRIFT